MGKGLCFSLWITVVICAGCGEKKHYPGPAGYDLNRPERFLMPGSLHEISGIAFHNGNSDTIYAEEDEDGRLYRLPWAHKVTSYSKFGKHGDYEDLAICREQVIMLRSDGVLFTFPFGQARDPVVKDVREFKHLLPDGEYEGLYADDGTGLVYVLCKHCGDDKTGKKTHGYILQLSGDGSLAAYGHFVVNVKEIETVLGAGRIVFHPSALSRNPLTQEWYILSSVNKLLVVADSGWNIRQVYRLNPALFRQPEGIGFDGENNLYISNEGGDFGSGNILKFVYKVSN